LHKICNTAKENILTGKAAHKQKNAAVKFYSSIFLLFYLSLLMQQFIKTSLSQAFHPLVAASYRRPAIFAYRQIFAGGK
jgi:hypothetical protein